MGFTLVNEECVDSSQQCGDNCDECDSDRKCTDCKNGFVLN